jgi:cell division protein FtsW (lipid II flippase)
MSSRLDRLLALLLIGGAAAIALPSFYSIGNEVPNALLITEYAFTIADGESKRFGYGGEAPEDRVDVLFQGREMNDIAFALTRRGDRFLVQPLGGRYDELIVSRTRLGVFAARRTYRPGDAATIRSGERFLTRGILGRAAFRLMLSTNDSARLRLEAPVVRPLESGHMRLTRGQELRALTGVPVNEILLRTRGESQSFRVGQEACGLRIEKEIDWSLSTRETRPEITCLQPRGSLVFGGLTLSFRNMQGVAVAGFNRVHLLGVRLVLGGLLIGLAFLVAPSFRLHRGWIVFGCVFLLMTVALVLQGRDFFLEPYSRRFASNLRLLYWMSVFLIGLRLPLVSMRKLLDQWKQLLICAALLTIAFAALSDPLDGSPYDLAPDLLGTVVHLIKIVAVWVCATVAVRTLPAVDAWWGASNHGFRLGLAATCLLPLFLICLTWAAGGREALTFTQFRVYLPAVLMPYLLLCFGFLLSHAERRPDYETRIAGRVLAIGSAAIPVVAYRVVSGDNGGTALLAIGVLLVAWFVVGSEGRKALAVTTVASVCAILVIGYFSMAERFELAWSGDSGTVVHYDAARNLRTARDMARAGGAFGEGVALPVPASLRANVHNDLVMSYITGYFGWVGAAFVVIVLWLFYDALLGSLRQWAKEVQTDGHNRRERPALVNTAIALTTTLLFQSAWVGAAALQSAVPLTGQDLPPLSASAISVVSFLGVIGLVLCVDNICQTESANAGGAKS